MRGAATFLNDLQKIYEDYAFIPPDGNGDITFAINCQEEVKKLLLDYGVTFKKMVATDGK